MSMHIENLAAHRAKRANKITGKSGPVTVTRVHPLVWARAIELATARGIAVSRLQVIDERTVIVP